MHETQSVIKSIKTLVTTTEAHMHALNDANKDMLNALRLICDTAAHAIENGDDASEALQHIRALAAETINIHR